MTRPLSSFPAARPADTTNKVAIALAVRGAMREYRKGKPISFPSHRWPE